METYAKIPPAVNQIEVGLIRRRRVLVEDSLTPHSYIHGVRYI
jgi:hypothetical protein